MPKVWNIKPSHSEDIIENLLQQRGITTQKQKDEFLNPQLSDFTKELDIPGITESKQRILKAIEQKEKIIVYGDYDVDGICATAVMYHGLVSLGASVLPYIPHREKEGYGLSNQALKQLKEEQNASLIITVDNGIVACDQVDYAAEIGLEVIITDHHTATEKLPKCVSKVHATNICGTAVAWCLIRHLIEEKQAEQLLDLVAIATICDLMPLIGVNRALVKEGLEVLNKTKRVGLLALLNECKLIVGNITAHHIGYILGPRINAIGRLEHAIDALRLLCTKDPLKARQLARLLCETNLQKNKLTADAILEAHDVIKQIKQQEHKQKILVLQSQNWVPGIIGIMAGRISEEYQQPAIVMSLNGDTAKGSARTSNGLNVVELIRQCQDLLIDVGGHPGAAGFTIQKSNIDAFINKLNTLTESLEIKEYQTLEIDMLLPLQQVSKKLLKELEIFEPFGLANPKPIFATENIQISDMRTLSEGKHLKFKANGIDAIAFSFGSMSSMIPPGQLINIAYYLEHDTYNGADKVQLKIVDINPV